MPNAVVAAFTNAKILAEDEQFVDKCGVWMGLVGRERYAAW
ncbi:hypothetical protein [Suttonella ornithocola]|nr:hypothetical protein [Suttonella ornithocola]